MATLILLSANSAGWIPDLFSILSQRWLASLMTLLLRECRGKQDVSLSLDNNSIKTGTLQLEPQCSPLQTWQPAVKAIFRPLHDGHILLRHTGERTSAK